MASAATRASRIGYFPAPLCGISPRQKLCLSSPSQSFSLTITMLFINYKSLCKGKSYAPTLLRSFAAIPIAPSTPPISPRT